MALQNLPIGTQSFENLRSNNYLYVDKTKEIYNLVTTGQIYFLSRPRRFGKSLLISTIHTLFECQKNLFEGLYICDKWNWDDPHPVVRIDWTQIGHDTPKNMSRNLFLHLVSIAQNNQIEYINEGAIGLFKELLEKLHKKTGKKVVVLIDEYDKPVTGHLNDGKAEEFRTIIHDFYQIIKGSDDHIRFVLLTGVSKFSGMSVFSALNNLRDITLDETYSTICGITQKELEENFADHIQAVADKYKRSKEQMLADIKQWYNGYSWDGETSVYNPFSTLNFLQEKTFRQYWFNTGTPTFLINILKERGLSNFILEPQIVSDNELSSGYSIEKLTEIPLLFQTGYLTIKAIEIPRDEPVYTLETPNLEVRKALMNELIEVYFKNNKINVHDLRRQLETRLRNADEAGLQNGIETLLALKPYDVKMNSEAHFHLTMLIWLNLLGFRVLPEKENDRGRCDLVLEERDFTVVAELEFSEQAIVETLLDEAMTQIDEKKYYNQYLGRVLKLAIAFTGKETGCRLVEIER
ncbi:MAG: ATP-binding protein [Dysgonamonadaceae bacterium]|nr:ATP-binding protein [Dysgonamonadaceae bacterium]